MLGLGRLEHGGIDLPVNDYVNIDDLMVINILPLKECKQKAQIIVLCPYIFGSGVGFEPRPSDSGYVSIQYILSLNRIE